MRTNPANPPPHSRWTLVLLVLFAAFSSGCQFLQNEFFVY